MDLARCILRYMKSTLQYRLFYETGCLIQVQGYTNVDWGHARTKHIEVHYHFVREKVLAEEVNLVHVSIKKHVANVFKKALGTEKLRKFWSLLGVLDLDLSLRRSIEISSSNPDYIVGDSHLCHHLLLAILMA